MTATRRLGVLGRLGLLAVLLAVAGCDSIGDPLEAIGARVPAPDEFQVMPRKPLEMPATAQLPEPSLGAPSPLEPNPRAEAMAALFGPAAAAGAGTAAPSASERALLSSANAAAGSGDVRVQLDKDKSRQAVNTPYVPPTLGELITGNAARKVDESELLDPEAEALRLQQQGIATPANPNAVAEEDEAPKATEAPMYQSGSPNQQIRGEQPVPAY